VERPDLVSKASDEILHAGAHAVGHGIGPKPGFHHAESGRGGRYRIRTEQAGDKRQRGVHVAYRPSLTARRAGLVTAVAGSGAGATEVDRRLANRKGAGISAGEPYRHPLRSGYKANAARAKYASEKMGRKADAKEARGKQAPVRRVLQNTSAYNSQAFNRLAVDGIRRGSAENRAHPYDGKKKYTPPQTIGKRDAFGVARDDIAKAGLGSVKGVLSEAEGMLGGFKHGVGGGTFGQVKGGTSAMLGAKAGNAVRAGGSYAKLNAKPLAIGGGVAGVGVGGVALGRKQGQ
jgi:hypothetical protein